MRHLSHEITSNLSCLVQLIRDTHVLLRATGRRHGDFERRRLAKMVFVDYAYAGGSGWGRSEYEGGGERSEYGAGAPDDLMWWRFASLPLYFQ